MHDNTKDRMKDAAGTAAGVGLIAAGCGIELLLTGLAIAVGLWLFAVIFG
jgi:hypothetical protein